jgi:hypothetical protein
VGREGEHERGAVDRRADGDAEGPTSHTGAGRIAGGRCGRSEQQQARQETLVGPVDYALNGGGQRTDGRLVGPCGTLGPRLVSDHGRSRSHVFCCFLVLRLELTVAAGVRRAFVFVYLYLFSAILKHTDLPLFKYKYII